MEKLLMRVTYKSPLGGIDTVGRAQVLISRNLRLNDRRIIKSRVKSLLGTLGNLLYADIFRGGNLISLDKPRDSKILLEHAKTSLSSVRKAGGVVVHVVVKIKNMEFQDFDFDLIDPLLFEVS